ncbi:hypothetical protein B0H11DRAFT_2199342 [Mycena galericulata]|nr:hypothetical protein B0H11DRAFT_2199342 [Mycena galericulata]
MSLQLAMSEEEENAFMESLVDFSGGMPPPSVPTEGLDPANPNPNPILDADTLLGLLSIRLMLERLDILRSIGGQRSTPVIELLRAKQEAGSAGAGVAPGAPQGSLVAQLLSLTPAQADPAVLARAAAADLAHRTPSFPPAEFEMNPPAPPLPRPRRKLNTSAVDTNGGRSIYPTTLDPTVPAPDLTRPVWVSCFTEMPSTPPRRGPASEYDADDGSLRSAISSPSSSSARSSSASPFSSPLTSPLSSPRGSPVPPEKRRGLGLGKGGVGVPSPLSSNVVNLS